MEKYISRCVFPPVVCPGSGPSPAACVPWRTHPGPHSWGVDSGRPPGGCGGYGTVFGSKPRSGPGSSRARRETGRAPAPHQPALHTGWAGWPSGWGLPWSTSWGTAWSLTRQMTCKASGPDLSHNSEGVFWLILFEWSSRWGATCST